MNEEMTVKEALKKGKRVLIVALDGLDYELIKKHNCQNIMQEEFGKIDNHKGIKKRATEELFTSFITGNLSNKHGVVGHYIYKSQKVEYIENFFRKLGPLNRFRKIRNALYEYFNAEPTKPTHNVIRTDTIFDKIPNSKALNVPGYNPSPLLIKPLYFIPLRTYDSISGVEKITNCEFNCQCNELFEEIDKGYDLLMSHFQKPDIYQHIYIGKNDKMIKNLYKEMDAFANEIKEKAKEKFDVIIFMSDHGLEDKKDKGQHNKNAFYSLNVDLGLNTPHMTDFHDLIINLVGETKVEIPTKREKDRKKFYSKEDKENIKKRLKDLGYQV